MARQKRPPLLLRVVFRGRRAGRAPANKEVRFLRRSSRTCHPSILSNALLLRGSHDGLLPAPYRGNPDQNSSPRPLLITSKLLAFEADIKIKPAGTTTPSPNRGLFPWRFSEAALGCRASQSVKLVIDWAARFSPRWPRWPGPTPSWPVPQAGGAQIRWLEGPPRPWAASDQSGGRAVDPPAHNRGSGNRDAPPALFVIELLRMRTSTCCVRVQGAPPLVLRGGAY